MEHAHTMGEYMWEYTAVGAVIVVFVVGLLARVLMWYRDDGGAYTTSNPKEK